jgi:primosomal replication protein N
MKKQKIKTFGLAAIQTSVALSDIETARHSLAFAVGATLTITGKVEKRVKRNEQCKLVVNPDNATMQVIADCKGDEQTVITRKIRKNSKVSIVGKLQSFGSRSVCLTDCRIEK